MEEQIRGILVGALNPLTESENSRMVISDSQIDEITAKLMKLMSVYAPGPDGKEPRVYY